MVIGLHAHADGTAERCDGRQSSPQRMPVLTTAPPPLPGLTHVYTLECNYNTSRVVNKLAHPHAPEGTDQNRSLSPQPPLRELHPKYAPDCD
jgi:hypothetical protein